MDGAGGTVAGGRVGPMVGRLGAMVGPRGCRSEAPGDVPATGEDEGAGAAQAAATIAKMSASTRTSLTGGMVAEAPG